MERRKRQEVCTCEFCGGKIYGDNGGKFLLPTVITGLPDRWAYTHNKCLRPFIEEWDALCRPITPRTIFENNHRRDLPEI